MELRIQIEGAIRITNPLIDDIYFIEQDGNRGNRFYVTSKKGYNGYEGNGYTDLSEALKQVKKLIATDIIDKE